MKAPVVRCDQSVRDRGTSWPRYHQCGRPVFENGKCKIHSAAGAAARVAKRNATYEAKQAASPYRQVEHLRGQIELLRGERAELVEALRGCVKYLPVAWDFTNPDDATADRAGKALEAARAILAKLSCDSFSFSLEFRAEVGKWELMQDGAHRGFYDSQDAAKVELAKLSGGAA